MDLDLKLVSKEINENLWRDCKTLSTAESCTAGRIASVITAVPGSSNYYKGGVGETKAGFGRTLCGVWRKKLRVRLS